MPGLARGCPQRLSVTQARSSRPTSILAMGLDGTGHYLAILTRHDLQVRSRCHTWCAFQVVRMGVSWLLVWAVA